MSIQEIIAPARPDWDATAGLAVAAGIFLALVLAIVAQGTVPAPEVDTWHGNVAVSSSR